MYYSIEMTPSTRTTISFPTALMDKFDAFRKENFYANRSEAFRDGMKQLMGELDREMRVLNLQLTDKNKALEERVKSLKRTLRVKTGEIRIRDDKNKKIRILEKSVNALKDMLNNNADEIMNQDALIKGLRHELEAFQDNTTLISKMESERYD